jgi:hypothetical protein
MTALNTDTNHIFETGTGNAAPILENAKIYTGALVGANADGYARPITAGDKPLGFATDITGGVVNVKAKGKVSLFIPELAMSDIGRCVYATDDNTFTLTESGVFVGVVIRFEKADHAIVAFDFFQPQTPVAESQPAPEQEPEDEEV